MTIVSANMVINNNRYIPITPYTFTSQNTDAYKSLLKYMNNHNNHESVCIDYDIFKSNYMILYFDIYNNLPDVLKDLYCKIEFRYIS